MTRKNMNYFLAFVFLIIVRKELRHPSVVYHLTGTFLYFIDYHVV